MRRLFLPAVLGTGALAGLWALDRAPDLPSMIGQVSPRKVALVPVATVLDAAVGQPLEHRVEIAAPAQQPDREASAGRRSQTSYCPKAAPNWLEAHQDEDGRWDADDFWKHDEGRACWGVGAARADIGCTSAVVLSFLGDGSTMGSGPYKNPVKKGVRWLTRQQQADGCFRTEIGIAEPQDHALATYTLCEAMGLSRYKTLRRYAQRALDHLGGLRSHSTDRDRVLFLGWQIHAYASARAFKLSVPDGAAPRALGELVRLRNRVPCLAPAVELACRFAMEQDPDAEPSMRTLATRVLSTPLAWGARFDIDRCFFATYAMYQHGGEAWKRWSRSLSTEVVNNRRSEQGPENGSWDPVGFAGARGGRVYATAMMTLAIEAYYRYTRLVR